MTAVKNGFATRARCADGLEARPWTDMPLIRYQEFIPHTVLQDHVKRFWILEKEYTTEDSIEEVTPDACVELILNFGSAYVHREGTKERELPKVCLVGLQSQPLRLQANG